MSGVDIGDTFGSPFTGQVGGYGLSDVINIVANTSIVLAGLVVLFLFIFAGYSIIMGAGSGNSEQSARGKKAATYAVLGFVLVLIAYWIIRFIEIISGTNFITAPGI